MPEAAPPFSHFVGRETELGTARRMIEQRVGSHYGFAGIGGIGKSTLLERIAHEAHRLAVTPYVVFVTLTADSTPLAFFTAVLDQLAASGKTKRRWGFLDTLAECRALLRHPPSTWANVVVNAQTHGSIGPVSVALHAPDATAQTHLPPKFMDAFRHLVRQQLPALVTMPPQATNYLPHRLLILLVDNVEYAPPATLALLDELRFTLTERLLLFCAGRFEPPMPTRRPHEAPLLKDELQQLDAPSCNAWLTVEGITDQALRQAITQLCDGVPLLLTLAINIVRAAVAQGHPPSPQDFTLPPPGTEGSQGLKVVEEFLIKRFIERFEQGSAQDHQMSLLLRYGCLLRTFSDRGSLKALQVPGLPPEADLDQLVRALGKQGLLTGEALHLVVRRAALAYLAHHDPATFRESCARAVAYYHRMGQTDEALTLIFLAGEADALDQFMRLTAEALTRGDLALVKRLLRVAAEAPPSDKLRWLLGFSRAALAQRRGAKTQAEQELVALLPLVAGNPALETDLLERLATLEPLQNGWLLHWWLPRQPDTTPNLLSRLLALSQAFENAYQLAVAITLAQTALRLAERLADQQGTADALLRLGEARLRQDEPLQAQPYLEQALATSRELGDRRGTAHALRRLGEARLMQDEPLQAQPYLEQALATSRELGDRLGTANALRSLGEALWAPGFAEQAKPTLREAWRVGAQIEYQWVQLKALETLIAIAKAEGETIVAKEYQVAYEQVRHAKR